MTLIHHWTFEEGSGSTVTDSVGGIILSLTSPDSFVAGHDGDFALSGDAEVTGGIGLATPASPFTLMAWAKPKTLSGSHTPLVGWWGDATLFSTGAALFGQRSDYGPSGVFQGNLRAGGSLAAVGGSALSIGTWVHLAVTYDGTTVRVFQDGVETGSSAKSGAIDSFDYFTIRASSADIDEVRIHDTALTAAEISSEMGPSEPVNQPPTANAGADRQTFVGTEVTLTGSGQDADGTIASYSWSQTAGPAVTLSGTGASRTFTPPSIGSYTFALSVTDDGGAVAADTVTITAVAIPEPSTGGPAPFGMIEKAVKSVIETNFPDDEVGGELSYAGGAPYVYIAKVPGGSTDQTSGEWTVDVDVFAESYGAAMRLSLDIEALLVRGRHVTPYMRIDNTYQDETPSERPWNDEAVFRVGGTYTFTARRSG
jgi:hypothetical protein